MTKLTELFDNIIYGERDNTHGFEWVELISNGNYIPVYTRHNI